jgi:hypothetical protein
MSATTPTSKLSLFAITTLFMTPLVGCFEEPGPVEEDTACEDTGCEAP